MLELYERLSEFSYGYGVTQEVEKALRSIGLRSVPFIPSLVHEAKVGFDVAFDKPGGALMLQFKLVSASIDFVAAVLAKLFLRSLVHFSAFK
jgi:hypothetical protein